MPKKSSKKSSDLEITEIVTSVPDDSQVPDESTPPAKKTARKKRSTKPKQEEVPAAAIMDPALERDEEAAAHAAETFDDAFEANGPAEAEAHATEIAEIEKAVAEPVARADREEADEDDKPRIAAPPAKLERLQKILAQAGVASRRHAEELITEGRVQVNGQVVTTLGSKADPARDHIRVDGKLLQGAERLRYFMLNKPRGYVTTVSDPEGRPTVMEFFTKMGERLYPVGRLDYLSEGLLVVTNDGELANMLTKAASGVEKTYLVKVSGQPSEEQIMQLREGVRIDRGKPGEGRVTTAPARIREIRMGENPWFEVVLIEGRNRELRKMFEEIGHFVEKIRRVGYGPLVLDVEPGKLRELDPQEVQALRLNAEGKWKPKRMKTTVMLPKEAGRSVDHEGARTGKKPFRGRPRPEQGGAEKREFRSSRPPQRDVRGGERPGSDRRQRSEGFSANRGPRREGFRQSDRPQGGAFARPREEQAEGAREQRPPRREGFSSQRPPRREGFGSQRPPRREGSAPGRPPRQDRFDQGERPQRPAFARRREEQSEGARPTEAGEQRRFDSRKPGRAWQGDRGPRREGGRGFAKPQGERPSSSQRPDRSSRPPRSDRGGERPAFSPRPRTGETRSRQGAEGERRFSGERPSRPSSGSGRPAFGSRPSRPTGQNRGGGGAPRSGGGARGGRPAGGNRGGGPKRRP